MMINNKKTVKEMNNMTITNHNYNPKNLKRSYKNHVRNYKP